VFIDNIRRSVYAEIILFVERSVEINHPPLARPPSSVSDTRESESRVESECDDNESEDEPEEDVGQVVKMKEDVAVMYVDDLPDDYFVDQSNRTNGKLEAWIQNSALKSVEGWYKP
jgi:hypothetical protein